jgi:hypothetical protein
MNRKRRVKIRIVLEFLHVIGAEIGKERDELVQPVALASSGNDFLMT